MGESPVLSAGGSVKEGGHLPKVLFRSGIFMLDDTEYKRWIRSSKRTLSSARGDFGGENIIGHVLKLSRLQSFPLKPYFTGWVYPPMDIAYQPFCRKLRAN